MKIVRFKMGKSIKHGLLDEDSVIELRGNIYSMFRQTVIKHPLSDVEIVCPVHPNQIWGAKYNLVSENEGYVVKEYGMDPWLKGSNSICGPNEPVIIEHDLFNEIGVTTSLVAVIGKQCKKINHKNVSKYILGYTCGIDVASKRISKDGKTSWKAKSSDNFSPIGPYIETNFDINNFTVTMEINGDMIQTFTQNDLPYSPEEIVSYICQQGTLQPGDLVFIGGPEPYSPVCYKDEVSCSIDGIGILTNSMVEGYLANKSGNPQSSKQFFQGKLVI